MTITAHASEMSYLPIEDYGLIGNLHTVALVGKNGSIDWCCLPRFDAPSVFGALIDIRKGGFFCIAPRTADMRYKQLYLPDTNVLLTRFLSSEGVGELTDFMPIKATGTADHSHRLVRSLEVVHGSLTFTLICRPAFNYAQDPHQLAILDRGAFFKSQHFNLSLISPLALRADGWGGVQATFTLHKGQAVHFLLESSSEEDMPQPLTEALYQQLFQETLDYWRTWLSQCRYQGRWAEMVRRSALVLKLLTYAPTGAIVAAPTTSLPELIGGGRNWDYRYTWLRDASFTLYSLLSLGFHREAEAFMGWLDERCHSLKRGEILQPMYGIDGEKQLTERTLDHLEGYRRSQPVRIGNGAYTQKQLDIYGELMDAIAIYDRYEAVSYDLWSNLHRLLGWLCEHWEEPDEGIWEVRGGAKHFLHSRLMNWVAFDRAIRIAHHRGWPAPIEKWRAVGNEIYQQIMQQGWSEQQRSFVQHYGSEAVDASSLLMIITHFTGAKEPRIHLTLERIQRELTRGALVYRYQKGQAADDGLEGREGAFCACSFWLVENLARAGRLDEARLMLEKLLSYGNHLGLYAEEMSPKGEALGNYPQALTHLALITACTNLDQSLNNRGH